MKKVFFAFAAWACMAQLSLAAISASWLPVITEAATNPPPGFKTYDLVVTTSTDWLGSNLVMNLTTGSIYNDANGAGSDSPNPAFFGFVPTLRWDSYVTNGKALGSGQASSAGGAVDLGGSPTAAWTATAINKNWFTTDLDNIGTFTVARITLSDGATGTFNMRHDAVGTPFFTQSGQLSAIPEPSTIALLLVGAVGAGIGYARKRKTA